MEALRRMLLALLATGFLLGAVGCDTQGPGQEAGEGTDQTMERSGEQMDQGTEPGQEQQ